MNAKEELIKRCEGLTLMCASIKLGDGYSYGDNPKKFELKAVYSEEELNAFINSLDFIYDSGYGGQELFGVLWFTDGTWAERSEYDGSEWWYRPVLPEIPEELK